MDASPKPARRRSRLSGVAVNVAALLLFALLVDAAIETYRSGSSVRYWVAVPVACYVAFSLWLYQQRGSRPGAAATAWLSAFVFLAVLAATATVPGGIVAGVRVATLPTSTVLSATTAAIILLALVSLAVESPLPLAGRVLAALAAGYGVAAFVLGIAWHRSYLQLLHGGGFWQRLPYWLQGAFVGALIVLPLAFILELGVAMARVKVKGRVHRLVAFALGFAIAYCAFTT